MIKRLNNILTKVTKIKSNKAIINFSWIIGEKIMQIIIGLLLTMIISRYLGPSNYGILNYGATIVGIFLVITKLGLDSIVVDELIHKKEDTDKIIGTSIVMRLISSLISIILIFIIVLILKHNSKLIIIVTVIQSISLIFQAFTIIDFWFQSQLKSKYMAIIKGIAYISISLYKILLLITKSSLTWFALSSVLECLLIAILLFIFYKKRSNTTLKVSYLIGKNLLSKSYHFIISGVMVFLYTQIDKLMIGSMLDGNQLGYYSAAVNVCTMWIFIPEAILVSARPIVFGAKRTDNKSFNLKLKQTYSIVFWISLLLTIITFIFAKQIIMLIYGNQFTDSIIVLKTLIWYVPFSQLGVARALWIVSENKNKYVKYYIMWGVIINIVLNYILIPIIGIMGSAIATLITEIFTCLITPMFYKETRIHTKLIFESILFTFVK